MLQPVAQDVDRTAAADLALQAGEELLARRVGVAEIECRRYLRLRGVQESAELRQVDAELAVVMSGVAADSARAFISRWRLGDLPWLARLRRIARGAGQRRADEALEAGFAGVGFGHRDRGSLSESGLPRVVWHWTVVGSLQETSNGPEAQSLRRPGHTAPPS